MTLTPSISPGTLQRLTARAEQLRCSVEELIEQWLTPLPEVPEVDFRILDAAASSILIVDARASDLPIVYANHAFERETGYARAEVLGRNARFLQGKDRNQRVLQTIRNAIQHGRECHVVLRNYRKDGSLFWNELRISPLRDVSGTVTHFMGIQNDVTARRKAEESLRRSQRRYKLLTHIISDFAMSVRVIDDQRFVYEWTVGSLPFMTWMPQAEREAEFVHIHPEDLAELRADLARTLQNQPTVSEYRVESKQGGYRWLRVTRRPVFEGALGRVVRFFAVAQDITEYRAAEERIQLHMRALETAANAIVITDREGLIEWANPAFTVLTGYSLDEALGKNPNVLVKSGLQDEAFYRDMWDTILSGKVWQGQLINRRKDTSLYTEELTITPVHNANGQITHFIAMKQDVTERERTQQMVLERERLSASLKREKEYNSTVQKALASLLHDIRTPLAMISTSKDLLNYYFDRMDADKRREKLEVIDKQLHYVTELLNDVTLITSTSLNHRKVKAERVNLEALCRLLVTDIQESNGSTHRLKFTTDHQITVVLADEVLINRILLNLLSNAIKYSPPDSEVCLDLSRREDWIVLRVMDHGIGIPSEALESVFEPFYRADNARAVGGTGLGLSIVKNCVQSYRGNVSVKSTVGGGTTVTVELPLEIPES